MPPQTRLTASSWLDLSPQTLLRTVWQGRWRLLAVVAGFAGIGVAVALLTPPEWVSEAKIMPEMGNKPAAMVKRLTSAAGLDGIDLADSDELDAVRPDLYPNVLQSTPFLLYLIDQRVISTGGQQTTVGHLLMPDQAGGGSWANRLGIEKKPLPVPHAKPAQPMPLSVWQQELVEEVGRRVSAKLDTRSGIITLSAKMPDAQVAAAVARLAMTYLTQYVTRYRTEKARLDLQFYDRRLNEARRRYQTAQLNVFRYNDRHQHVVLLATTMEKQRMEAELSIAQLVYTELAQQFEQAKLRVQQHTPVFNVLEPARVPPKRASPKRTLTVLVFMLVGLVAGVLYERARQTDLPGQLRLILNESDAKPVDN